MAHPTYFGFLLGDDRLGEGVGLRVGSVLKAHPGHIDRASLVRNHSLHESDIRIGMALPYVMASCMFAVNLRRSIQALKLLAMAGKPFIVCDIKWR